MEGVFCKAKFKPFRDKYYPYARQAPDPTDIYWENLGYSTMHSIKANANTWFFTSCLIGIGFGVLYGLSLGQEALNVEGDGNDESSNATIITSLILGLMIVGINFALKVGVRKLVAKEIHETNTNFIASMALKLTIAQSVATGMLVLAINTDFSTWFESGGLVTDMFYIQITNAFVSPIVKFLNIP